MNFQEKQQEYARLIVENGAGIRWRAPARNILYRQGLCRKHRKGDSKPFVSTEWQLVQLNGRAVPVEGDLFTVVFGEDGRLSGLGACNRLMGSERVKTIIHQNVYGVE